MRSVRPDSQSGGPRSARGGKGSTKNPKGANSNDQPHNPPEEFFSTRLIDFGDSFRLIHWQTTDAAPRNPDEKDEEDETKITAPNQEPAVPVREPDGRLVLLASTSSFAEGLLIARAQHGTPPTRSDDALVNLRRSVTIRLFGKCGAPVVSVDPLFPINLREIRGAWKVCGRKRGFEV